MASITNRRNRDGSTSWDALVRVVGYPATGQSFRTKRAAELWAAQTEARAKGGTLASARGMTLAQLIDEALPQLLNPTMAAFAYWREHLGDVRLSKLEAALTLSRCIVTACSARSAAVTTTRPPRRARLRRSKTI